MASAPPGHRLSRDDYRKQKELEEARKAGTAPAEVDEHGHEINPHIPQYIARAPWYMSRGMPSLTHQRQSQKDEDPVRTWYRRGEIQGEAPKKFRPGSCQNCGAMTHTSKDCMERPRRRGAKYTGKDMKADEIVEHIEFDYDGKRDRWAGYDTSEHLKLLEKHARVEAERKRVREKMVGEKLRQKEQLGGSDSEDEHDDEKDDFVEEEGGDGMATVEVGTSDPRTHGTVRNLRIREDTAKYLLNLDDNSAYYDPKTHSMRVDPNPHLKDDESGEQFRGDNVVRLQGDVPRFHDNLLFVMESQKAGDETGESSVVNMSAMPTQAELAFNEFKKKKEDVVEKKKKEVLEKYGGNEHSLETVEEPIRKILESGDAQSEFEAVYSRNLRETTIKSKAMLAQTKYEEDVWENGHTSVWGSYWEDGKWGYDCCKQTVKGSFCKNSVIEEVHKEKSVSVKKNELYGGVVGDDVELDEAKVQAEVRKEEERQRREVEDENDPQAYAKRKRTRGYDAYASEWKDDMTVEEMEAYHLKKRRLEDPMADYVDEED